LENLFIKTVGDYNLRRCSKDDLSEVISINLTTLPEHYSDYFFEDLLRSAPEGFLVAEKNGRIAGYIMCRIEYGFSNFKRFSLTRKGHVVSLAVTEGNRRKGLGEALVRNAIEALKPKGCTEIYLEVRVSNHDAVRLYRRIGFEVITTMEGYYRDNEEAYLMAQNIAEK
jgi:ribosomal-protein-alanine N-acetyltransferase